jgi:hypothetical protein
MTIWPCWACGGGSIGMRMSPAILRRAEVIPKQLRTPPTLTLLTVRFPATKRWSLRRCGCLNR